MVRARGDGGKLRALLEDGDAFGVLGWGASGSAPAPEAIAPPVDRAAGLALIAEEACACRRCPLGSSRTKAVPGQGNPAAELMFVGEAPGADEDVQGLAFVGAA